MIFALILIAWLTVVAIVVNACRSAAHGDDVLAQSSPATPRRGARAAIGGGVPWRDGPALMGTRQMHHAGAISARPAARATRARGGHCATGS